MPQPGRKKKLNWGSQLQTGAKLLKNQHKVNVFDHHEGGYYSISAAPNLFPEETSNSLLYRYINWFLPIMHTQQASSISCFWLYLVVMQDEQPVKALWIQLVFSCEFMSSIIISTFHCIHRNKGNAELRMQPVGSAVTDPWRVLIIGLESVANTT